MYKLSSPALAHVTCHLFTCHRSIHTSTSQRKSWNNRYLLPHITEPTPIVG